MTHLIGTDDELSIVYDQSRTPEDVQCERSWRSLKLCGPFAFNLTQVLQPPADADIGIFVISTFDTDDVEV